MIKLLHQEQELVSPLKDEMEGVPGYWDSAAMGTSMSFEIRVLTRSSDQARSMRHSLVRTCSAIYALCKSSRIGKTAAFTASLMVEIMSSDSFVPSYKGFGEEEADTGEMTCCKRGDGVGVSRSALMDGMVRAAT
jgi:hypothetical protein